MTSLELRVGSLVIDPDGQQWSIVAIEDSGNGVEPCFLLRATSGPSRLRVLINEVLFHWTTDLEGARPSLFPWGLLDGLEEEHRKEFEWRRHHVVELCTGQAPGAETPNPRYSPELPIGERLRAKEAELADNTEWPPPAERTLRRWRTAYLSDGDWGLLKKDWLREADPLSRADDRIVSALRTELGLLRDDSTLERIAVINRAKHRLKDEFERDSDDQGVEEGDDDAREDAGDGDRDPLKMPALATWYRYVEALNQGTYAFADAPTRRSNWFPEEGYAPTYATRPGEWVQADTSDLNVLTVYPYKNKVFTGAVRISVALDVATRSVVSWRFTPMQPKTVDVSMLLAGALTPEPMRPDWEERLRATHESSPLASLVSIDDRLAAAASRPVIFPEVFATDRGKQYVSKTTYRVAERLGISLNIGRPYTGSDKAAVERSFRSVNSLFTQYLKGYRGRNTTQRGYDVDGKAVFLLEDLHALFSWWVVDVWQRRIHKGLRNLLLPGLIHTPNQMYAAAVAVSGYVPRPLSDTEYIALLPHDFRVVSRRGIQKDNRIYDSPELRRYQNEPSGLLGQKNKWMIHVDPTDLSRIWLHDHRTDEMVAADWIYRDKLAQPFSAEVWNLAWQLVHKSDDFAPNEAGAAQLLAKLEDGDFGLDHRAQAVVARASARPDLVVVPASPDGLDDADTEDEEDRDEDAFSIFDPGGHEMPL